MFTVLFVPFFVLILTVRDITSEHGVRAYHAMLILDKCAYTESGECWHWKKETMSECCLSVRDRGSVALQSKKVYTRLWFTQSTRIVHNTHLFNAKNSERIYLTVVCRFRTSILILFNLNLPLDLCYLWQMTRG